LTAHELQQTKPHKLFIVDRGDERLCRALRDALANEPDVGVFFDRRDWSHAGRWRGEERRVLSDVEERIRTEGFAVVRPGPPAPIARNVHWT
jgi:hypothetical protein